MKQLLLLVAILLIATQVYAQTNLVTNGNFDNGLTGWGLDKSFTSANVYFGIINSSPLLLVGDPPNSNYPIAGFSVGPANYIDTWIYQVMSGLTIGQTYTMSCDYAGAVFGPSGNTSAWWEVGLIPGGYNAGTIDSGQFYFDRRSVSTIPGYAPWKTASDEFTATQTTYTFYMRAGIYPAGYNYFAAYLDNVQLSAVPEPGSIAAFGTIALGMAGALVRKRK